MAIPLDWSGTYEAPVIALSTVTVAYLAYHFGGRADRLTAIFHLDDDEGGQIGAVVLKRTWGVVCLGLVPTLVSVFLPDSLADYGLALGKAGRSLALVAAVAIGVVPLIYWSSHRPGHWRIYPEIRAEDWDVQLLGVNALGWIVYLAAYEFCFRGFLLFSLAGSLGAWPAIVITTAFYAAVHLPKSATESFGAIPIGVLFGVVALDTGSLLGPFLAHVIIALSNDALALRHAPEMRASWRTFSGPRTKES